MELLVVPYSHYQLKSHQDPRKIEHKPNLESTPPKNFRKRYKILPKKQNIIFFSSYPTFIKMSHSIVKNKSDVPKY